MEINEVYKNKTLYFSPIGLQEKYGLNLIFTTATKGQIKEKSDDFNLSFNDEYKPSEVTKNRKLLLHSNEIKTENPIIFLRQRHGSKIIIIDENFMFKFKELYLELDMISCAKNDIRKFIKIKESLPEGDGLITALPDIPIMVLGADCNIILICDIKQRIIAAVHAGWRGVLDNILSYCLNMLIDKFGSRQKDLMIFFGPSIRKCCFEIGSEIYKDFKTEFEETFDEYGEICNDGKYFIDLIGILKYQAFKTGIFDKNISVVGDCTCCSYNSLFFSYRKDKKAGRQAALAYISQKFQYSN